MTDHVAIGIVDNNEIEAAAADSVGQLLGQQRRGHLGLQIISGDLRSGYEYPLLAFERWFGATVKEEGDVRIFFRFSNA